MRRMKEEKKARQLALKAEEKALYDAHMAKWAKGFRCLECGNLFDTRARLKRHEEFSNCERHVRRGRRVLEARRRLIDPDRPELGRAPKGTLMYEALARAKAKAGDK